ncbi:MAG: 16S rRNA (guanine(966)-N(2))-methyltransferase RsmD [Coriobacteriia bacterium]|nr:16S rRNA (guanine(966)-N(2))-methyltransferase RsmD [Coriobacteriia bacterium]
MRIIAGTWRGQRLQTPTGRNTRPSSDRLREALFSSLHSRLGSFEGLLVLDAFAGSGALGLEALSRGAAKVVAVEADQKAAIIIESNYKKLSESSQRDNSAKFAGEMCVICEDIFALPRALKGLKADLLFFDPPYDFADEKLCRLLDRLRQRGVFADGALIVIERCRTADAQKLLPANFRDLTVKFCGDSSLHFACAPPGVAQLK